MSEITDTYRAAFKAEALKYKLDYADAYRDPDGTPSVNADELNMAAYPDNWTAKCARASINILSINYYEHKIGIDSTAMTTVVSYEYLWRFGGGDGERRWAKNTVTFNDTRGDMLTHNAANMLVYEMVQESRKVIENGWSKR